MSFEDHLNDEKFKEIFAFETPREGQREIIENIIKAFESGKKYVVLEAPTGTGKGVIGYSVARYFGSSYILTSQKVLQTQYYKDFKIPFVLGRANYTCQKDGNLNCDMGACYGLANRMCYNNKKELICPYAIERNKCLSSFHSNLNYSYFLSIINMKDYVKPRSFIVCDEAHNLESELLEQYKIEINEKTLKLLGLDLNGLPSGSVSDSQKCKWLCYDFLEKIQNQYLFMKNQINSLTDLKSTREYKKISVKYKILEQYLIKLHFIKSTLSSKNQIVISSDKGRLEFKLLHCNEIFKNTMMKYSERFLFMSATILDCEQFAKDLGIDMEDMEFIRCDSRFPVENRYIHYSPVGSMSYKCKYNTLPKMTEKIEKILSENENVKGIIHTVNYEIADYIYDHLRFGSQGYRLLIPKGTDRQFTLERFFSSDKPFILLSPSLTEGIDLKEDLSRLCIICKVPYGNLGDRWIKSRMEESTEWYRQKACISMVQMTGRSIRSETDYAKTYILDKDFEKLAASAINIFPKWWQDSVIIG